MKQTVKYLEEIKAKYELKSDNALANMLGISRQAISNYRHEGNAFDDTTALRVAELLEKDPMEVIAAANYDRAKSEKEKQVWGDFYKRLGGIAASFTLVTMIVTPTLYEASNQLGAIMGQCILC